MRLLDLRSSFQKIVPSLGIVDVQSIDSLDSGLACVSLGNIMFIDPWMSKSKWVVKQSTVCFPRLPLQGEPG